MKSLYSLENVWKQTWSLEMREWLHSRWQGPRQDVDERWNRGTSLNKLFDA